MPQLCDDAPTFSVTSAPSAVGADYEERFTERRAFDNRVY